MNKIGSMMLALLCAGCASVSVRRLDKGDAGYDEGVRFYRPWPYLSITKEVGANNAKTLKAEIVMLPDADPSNEYVVQWSAGWFGTTNPNVTLSEGWNLTGFNSKVEAGTSALLTSLAGVATSIKDVRTTGEPELVPGLYRMQRKEIVPKSGTTGAVWAWVPMQPAIFVFKE
jgi:hypothetical protein